MVVNTTWAGSTVPTWELQEDFNVEWLNDFKLPTETTWTGSTLTTPDIIEPVQQEEVVSAPIEQVTTPVVDTKPVEVTPVEKVEPIATQPIESAQDIKSKELDNQQKESTQKETERQARNQDILTKSAAFDEAAKAWNLELMNQLATDNPDLKTAFNTSLRNVFGNKQNLTFFSQYQGATNDEMKAWVDDGSIVIWSKQYNLLPEEQRRRFEQFNKLNAWKRTDFSNDNQNTISTEDITAKVPTLTTVDFRAEMNKLLSNPELTQTRADLESKQNEITEIDDALEALEDDLVDEFPWMPRSFILAEKAKRSKDLIRSKNTLVNQYNAKLGTYKDIKSNIDMELDVLKFEDAQNKAVYQTELERYKSNRAEMREDEKLKFLEDNKKLSAETQFERQKELAEFNKKLSQEGNTWGKYFDDGEGNMVYVKNGKEINVLSWLGKTVSTSEDNNYTWQIKENEDGWYTAFGLPKKGGNIMQKTYTANWAESTDYIKSTGTGEITSHGGKHDKFQWLDIDGNVWDPIAVPLWGKVLEVSKHPWYGNTMLIEMSDWNKIRYSHLDTGYFKEWDTIGKGSIIGTMWNTGNVLKLDWTKPNAQELAQWFGSHLDIVTTDPEGNVRSGKETESYLNNIGLKKESSDVLSKEEKVFFNQQQSKFLSNPQVKAFESALSSAWDLSLSLDASSWPGDVAAIFQFMKTLDPASVVRESEFAVAGNSAGISSKPEILLNKISTWELLTDNQRIEFGRLAFEYVKNKWKSYDRVYDDMARILDNNWIWGSNLPTRATDLVDEFNKNKIDVISWGKTYTTTSGYSYDTTWANQERSNFFNN